MTERSEPGGRPAAKPQRPNPPFHYDHPTVRLRTEYRSPLDLRVISVPPHFPHLELHTNMGKTLLVPKLSHAICESVREGATLKDAALLNGIGERTLHDWVQKGEDGDETYHGFALDIRRAQAFARKACVSTIRHAAVDDPKWAAWLLERTDPANWGRKPPQSERQSYLDDEFFEMMYRHKREFRETAIALAESIVACMAADDDARRHHAEHAGGFAGEVAQALEAGATVDDLQAQVRDYAHDPGG